MSNLSEYLDSPNSDDLPDYLSGGEKARLFPVLKAYSLEGRCTSIFLSCLSHVKEFGEEMLTSVGHKAVKRAKINTYTEVTFNHSPEGSLRPDGLIVMTWGNREWKALVEAKVGTKKENQLTDEQVSNYVKLANDEKIDAVITISNQFTSKPEHHPIKLSKKIQRNVAVYHWSWWFIVTQAYLLTSNADIKDGDQHLLLEEMLRFFIHKNTEVSRFKKMPPEWKSVVEKISRGSQLQNKGECEKIISSWHQKIQDIALMLSCQINAKVKVNLSTSQDERVDKDITSLKENHSLAAELIVPNVAKRGKVAKEVKFELKADIKAKLICVSKTIMAPTNRKRNSSLIKWLLNQLQKSEEQQQHNIYVSFHRKYRKAKDQVPLTILNKYADNNYNFSEYEDEIKHDRKIDEFEVSMIQDLGKKFARPEIFINKLEDLVSDFYENVLINLTDYKAPGPRKSNRASSPASVTSDGAHGTAQEEA